MMRLYILLLFLGLLISCDTENKFPDTAQDYFVKFYGEDGDHDGVDFVVNSDGSFILLGNERIAGSPQQIYLVKVDALGTVVWHSRFGSGSAGDEFAKDIEFTADGNIIIAAETQKALDDKDVFVKIVSQTGAPLDSIRVGLKTMSNLESDEEVNSISIIHDGFIVSGSTTAVIAPQEPNNTKDALHLRFTLALDLIEEDVVGQPLWTFRTQKDDSEDVLVKMIEINPSLYYGFGFTNTISTTGNNNQNFKYWAFSLNNYGTTAGVDELFGVEASNIDQILSGVIESPLQSGSGFALSGIKTIDGGGDQSYILKLRNPLTQGENNILSEAPPIDLGTNVSGKTSMKSIASGGFFLLTNSRLASNDNLNISLTKLSNTLQEVWQVPIYFGGAGDDFTGSVTELPDGKIMIIGTMTLGGVSGQTKMVLMKLNSDGRLSD
jgi:hypothetical protein